MDETKEDVRETIATACRILAMLGLVRETTGHISARIDDERMLIRCRGKSESGLVMTQAEAVRSVRFDGSDLERADEYETPTELPIHGEIYRARNDVKAVVHAHPRASMLCSILRLELRPIFGAFDPASMKLGAMGVPVFPRSALVRDREMGQQLASTLGYKPVCLMYGHGIVSTGASVQEATITAIKLETLASLTLECAKTGIQPEVIGEEDRLYFQRLKETQSVDATAHSKDVFNWTWRHYTRLLEAYERRGS